MLSAPLLSPHSFPAGCDAVTPAELPATLTPTLSSFFLCRTPMSDLHFYFILKSTLKPGEKLKIIILKEAFIYLFIAYRMN